MEGADDASALELVVRFSRPAQQEESEDDVAEPVTQSLAPHIFLRQKPSMRRNRETYRSRFNSRTCRFFDNFGIFSRILTGSLDEPGMAMVVVALSRCLLSVASSPNQVATKRLVHDLESGDGSSHDSRPRG